MHRRRRRQAPLQRFLAFISRWGRNTRVRWRSAEKYAWLVTVGAAAVVSVFVVLLNMIHANKVEQQNLACLALNVYFEARGEPEAGRYAVAEVTMNRVASPRYPDTVCEVVYEKNWDALRRRYVSAFSWTEFKTRPEPTGADWVRALRIADEVYHGRRQPKLAGVTHYHADYIKPSWSRNRTPVARIGNHVFYR
jgi:spore germination cell wall hydrolase CwlJ-like protein